MLGLARALAFASIAFAIACGSGGDDDLFGSSEGAGGGGAEGGSGSGGCGLPICEGECPTAQPTTGDTCSSVGMICNYPIVCGSAQATCTANGTWEVFEQLPGCAASCPERVPEQGSSCDSCCGPPGTCTYPDSCGEIIANCFGGVWNVEWPACPGPLCPDHYDEASCLDAGCQWLVPGCGEPQLPAPGCFDPGQCSEGTCGAKTCKTVVVDPCWNLDCAACSQEVNVCL